MPLTAKQGEQIKQKILQVYPLLSFRNLSARKKRAILQNPKAEITRIKDLLKIEGPLTDEDILDLNHFFNEEVVYRDFKRMFGFTREKKINRVIQEFLHNEKNLSFTQLYNCDSAIQKIESGLALVDISISKERLQDYLREFFINQTLPETEEELLDEVYLGNESRLIETGHYKDQLQLYNACLGLVSTKITADKLLTALSYDPKTQRRISNNDDITTFSQALLQFSPMPIEEKWALIRKSPKLSFRTLLANPISQQLIKLRKIDLQDLLAKTQNKSDFSYLLAQEYTHPLMHNHDGRTLLNIKRNYFNRFPQEAKEYEKIIVKEISTRKKKASENSLLISFENITYSSLNASWVQDENLLVNPTKEALVSWIKLAIPEYSKMNLLDEFLQHQIAWEEDNAKTSYKQLFDFCSALYKRIKSNDSEKATAILEEGLDDLRQIGGCMQGVISGFTQITKKLMGMTPEASFVEDLIQSMASKFNRHMLVPKGEETHFSLARYRLALGLDHGPHEDDPYTHSIKQHWIDDLCRETRAHCSPDTLIQACCPILPKKITEGGSLDLSIPENNNELSDTVEIIRPFLTYLLAENNNELTEYEKVIFWLGGNGSLDDQHLIINLREHAVLKQELEKATYNYLAAKHIINISIPNKKVLEEKIWDILCTSPEALDSDKKTLIKRLISAQDGPAILMDVIEKNKNDMFRISFDLLCYQLDQSKSLIEALLCNTHSFQLLMGCQAERDYKTYTQTNEQGQLIELVYGAPLVFKETAHDSTSFFKEELFCSPHFEKIKDALYHEPSALYFCLYHLKDQPITKEINDFFIKKEKHLASYGSFMDIMFDLISEEANDIAIDWLTQYSDEKKNKGNGGAYWKAICYFGDAFSFDYKKLTLRHLDNVDDLSPAFYLLEKLSGRAIEKISLEDKEAERRLKEAYKEYNRDTKKSRYEGFFFQRAESSRGGVSQSPPPPTL